MSLFKAKQPFVTAYTMTRSDNPDDIARRLNVLTTLLNVAERKELHVAEYRQRLFNFALLIFAAVIAFSTRSDAGPFRAAAAVSLFVLMIIFALIDRRFHKCGHGWRRTEWERTDALMALAGAERTSAPGVPADEKPSGDLTIQRYCLAGESTAEPFSLQPVITYLLVVGSFLNLCFSVYGIPQWLPQV